MQTDNRDLWKQFGQGNDVGNLLHSMYSQKEKVQINYPAVKTVKKPTVAEEMKMGKMKGECPQKTVIEYPEMPRKQFKYHAVDFIPKRKNANEILGEIEKEKNKPLVCYGQRGKDRGHMIEEL